MIVGENVKRILSAKGIKQKTIAERAGYTEQTFSNMLNGRKNIYDEDVLRISRALEVLPNDLFGLSEERGKKTQEPKGGAQ